ncbi:MAG: hypothetical protein LDL33_15775 [Desulfomonile sp.]|nr:hypothetical protein [Desulfomonile sp.]
MKLTERVKRVKERIRFDELFRKLYPHHYRPNGKSLCPFHKDVNPSFEVKAAYGKCFAGCVPPGGKMKTFDVFSLWMVHSGCDFATAEAELAERAGISIGRGTDKTKAGGNRAKRNSEATMKLTDVGKTDDHQSTKPFRLEDAAAVYDYHDAAGQVAYKVGRFYAPDKTFRPFYRTQDGTWKLGLKRVKRVPFGLPELLAAAPDDPVILVEGEKDVLSARKIGFTATTTQGGAEGWDVSVKAGAHEFLRDRIVWLIPDCDDAGKRYAHAATKTLHPIVRLLKIIALPAGGKQGYDLSDFIDEHGDAARDKLLKLVEQTAPWTPPVRPEPGHTNKDEKQSRPNKVKRLMDLFTATGADVFLDEHGAGWACIEIDGVRQNMRLASSEFTRLLLKLYFQAHEEGVSKDTIAQVADLLEARATETRELHVRFAWNNDRLYIDTGWPGWEAIEVSAENWQVVRLERPPFKRFPHQRPLPMPDGNGVVDEVLHFLPVRDAHARVLVQVWLVAATLAHIPRPGLIVHGRQGAGKSTFAEFLRSLLDPSSVPTHSLSKDPAEFVQMMSHHAVICLDNLHTLPQWASDALCRAVTGAGFQKRRLYSDDSDIIYQFTRCYVLNGINIPGTSPDLLDRSIMIELERIQEEDRREKGEVYERFEEARPRIFGGMLNALSEAMRIKETIDLKRLPRMADFTRWGCAIADAIGLGRSAFLDAYYGSIMFQHEEIVNSDPVCLSVLELMQDKSSWRGGLSELFKALFEIAEKKGLDKSKGWPRAANSLSGKLTKFGHNLAEMGIQVERDRANNQRTITIRKSEGLPDRSSRSSHRHEVSDIGRLPGDGPVTIQVDEHEEIVTGSSPYNQAELLPNDDGDGRDDQSGQPAVLDPADYSKRNGATRPGNQFLKLLNAPCGRTASALPERTRKERESCCIT